MSKLHSLNAFLTARLTAAAVDIFGAVEKTITAYQEEVSRSKVENDHLRRLLLDFGFKPDRESQIPDPQQLTVSVSGEEVPSKQEWSDQEDTETIFIPPCVESASDQDSPQSSYLYQIGKNSKRDSLPTNSTEPIKTNHDGEDYGASESTSNSQTMSKSKHTQAKKGQSPLDTGITSELRAPMVAHTGDRPHKCPVCRKRFTNNNHLKTHQRIHTGERPHWCKECGKCFSRKGDLGTHMRTHTGEKPYQCSVCGKSFRRNRLNEHMRVHTGERPYRCADCEKGFISVSDLKRHQRIHTGEKPFRCDSCGKCFSQMTTLKKHMRTVHKKVQLQSSEESPDPC
ncbi:zinc finger protein 664-like [Oncorhynchus mykiss]|uniref:C2H2-type domain-containing protein n=1 Tax=Oncorhynchus mykiss TaxID=8022 RepID=A0A8C7VTW1_ONCMY|nr:zinc finger protein 664-like [Oncorhynchus mykiss]